LQHRIAAIYAFSLEGATRVALRAAGLKHMRVIYIAGTSHSGSTLLDLMLNAHPQIVSVGEIVRLKSAWIHRKPAVCTCRNPVAECAFWLRVDQRARELSGRSLTQLDILDHSSSDERSAPNATVFRAISDVTGNAFIVDSSKSPERLGYLMSLRGLNVYPIHLIRSPKAQIASVVKKRNTLFKAISRYEMTHQQIRKNLRRNAHAVVRYEDLVNYPERTLSIILEPLGLSFDPQQLSWALKAKHNISGNRMRRYTTSELVLDERWKTMLSHTQKLAIDIGTLRARLLNQPTGYFPA
jgi:hypothetical protein